MPGCRAGLGGGRLTGHHPSAVTLTYGTPCLVMARRRASPAMPSASIRTGDTEDQTVRRHHGGGSAEPGVWARPSLSASSPTSAAPTERRVGSDVALPDLECEPAAVQQRSDPVVDGVAE